ncbi:MAG: diaminopimelate decarboxylase [Candidatus Altiarchaeales archaeon]|nr:MAG: diaminopimelate decarboxylase [Candidatus Altiarchaeales archaeon]
MEPRILMKLAEMFGTPLYVYDEDVIRKNYRVFLSAFKSLYKMTRILYAYKANSNLAICHILRQEGAGADVVSLCELRTALNVGIKPYHIIFTNNSKTEEEIEECIRAGVIINIDSMDELSIVNRIANKLGKRARISFRVNPSVNPKTNPKIATGLKESKFGLHIERGIALNAYRIAKEMENLEIVGIHTHIGSQITDVGVFEETTTKIMEFVEKLNNELEIRLEFIDLGGGLGISYKGEDVASPKILANRIVPILREYIDRINYEPELWLEPGRWIVGNSAVLLCRVNSVKETPYKKFVNVDVGFNAFMRSVMYDAYHRIYVVNKWNQINEETYDIAGNICESGDILAKNRRLPRIERGDLIAIMDVGAYGFSMSSQYNSRPRPAEVLIWGETVEVIRERETHEDLLRNQRVPKDLLE